MGRKSRISNLKIRYLVLAATLIVPLAAVREIVQAESCPDVRAVFARGSGEEHNNDRNYLEFKSTIEEKLKTTTLSYEFIDLDYPAVGIDNVGVAVGAYIGAGEAYRFGESVNTGVRKLVKLVNGSTCPGTKYTLGGYSQGAMVVSKSLRSLDADRIIYAATFGDPKLYLPEGKGIYPAACRGGSLSNYRMYVPDCMAYKGLLGAYIPYQPSKFIDKLGTWCNKSDLFCSSGVSVSHHVAYVADNLYEDASRVIFDKITKSFGVENKVSSLHDTAILIDSTGSMQSTIDKYKAEALKLAEKTFAIGGRIALYDYRDLDDPYEPVARCDFESCTMEKIVEVLDSLELDGGGDDPESLLSASYLTMQSLKWRLGATKSLVVLTDAIFLNPDRDGMTLEQVVALSKTIDPVNFYIVTEPGVTEYYTELAERTDGKVISSVDELSLATNYIIERYDSLPRVEESMDGTRPSLVIENLEYLSSSSVRVGLGGDFADAFVVLNEALLGQTTEREIVIDGLDLSKENTLVFTPSNGNRKGEPAEVRLEIMAPEEGAENAGPSKTTVLKAPNTGRFK